VFKQRYYRNINTLSHCRQVLIKVTPNLMMSQQGKVFKQRYNLNINNLSLCRPVLLSGNFQSEHVAAEERFQTTTLSDP